MWSVRSVWFVWLHGTNQLDQTDRACPRRARYRSSAVPKWFFRRLLGYLSRDCRCDVLRICAVAFAVYAPRSSAETPQFPFVDEPHRLPFPSEQDTPWSAGAYPSEYRIARPAPVSSTREKPDDQGIGLGHNGKQFRHSDYHGSLLPRLGQPPLPPGGWGSQSPSDAGPRTKD